ncbi:DUF6233 domain-containing protein [Streptomyces sp. NPDC048604]|uniref:DUF6233 domain-containing protein n=1 Tax=Streptomyces sp. NPDC048604 TaxID=3365578 RepID=UPI003718357E
MLSTSERLARHRVLREWLAYQLALADRTIRDLEAQEAEEKRRREVARTETSFTIQPARAVEGHPVLHRGACEVYRAGYSLLDREGVAAAFQDSPDLEMCDVCRPWGSLGIDKPLPGTRAAADPYEPA